jgi:two-component system copper resistance phosphate regulon response regulator CusR
MKLLIVEDDQRAAESLAQGLREAGHEVEASANGADGLARAVSGRYDLVMLDIMLPVLDGWSVLESLRQSRSTPVIMVTARDRVADKVRALRSGADDYLVKPFAFAELLARIESILRRGRPDDMAVLQIADLRLDPVARQAERASRRVPLTQKEFALLHLFMQRRGETLTRPVIAAEVWGIHFATDTNAVDVAVRRLRGKIDDGFEPRLIHTQRGSGYVMEVRNG